MRGMRGFVAIGLVLGALACDRSPPPVSGVYTWGHEVETFQPCGDAAVFWVEASESVLQELRTAHDSLTSEPYQGVFLQAHVTRAADATDGFAEQYDGVVRVTEVMEIEPVIPQGCR